MSAFLANALTDGLSISALFISGIASIALWKSYKSKNPSGLHKRVEALEAKEQEHAQQFSSLNITLAKLSTDMDWVKTTLSDIKDGKKDANH